MSEPMVIIRLATARRVGLADNEGWVIEEPLSWLVQQMQKYVDLANASTEPTQKQIYTGAIYAYAELYRQMAGISDID